MSATRLNKAQVQRFQKMIWTFYRANARALPWRETRDPYRIFVSEVMLQQTQAPRVVEPYKRFIRKFPNWRRLAGASVAEVLREWQGLGYNRRALNLRRAAEVVVQKYRGRLPHTPEELDALPGVGYATACAVAAFAFDHAAPYIETNIRSVYLECFFAGHVGVGDEQLMPLVERTLDRKNPREWYYALMDYGVFLKKSRSNPSRRSRHHTRQSRFEGSRRQVRGAVLKLLAEQSRSYPEIAEQLGREINCSSPLAREVLDELTLEGFISQRRSRTMTRYALKS